MGKAIVMKPKGVGFIEQHIEKAVFAVFVLILVAVVAMQFVTPLRVTVGGQEVAPAEAARQIKADAESAINEMNTTQPLLPVPTVSEDVADQLVTRLDTPPVDVVYATALAGAIPESIVIESGTGSSGIEIPTARYEIPPVPGPDAPLAVVYAGTIDPLAVAERAGLSAYVGDQQPFDKFFVSVEADFDAAAYRELVNTAGDGGATLSLLPEMQSFMEISRVVLVRERLTADGWDDRAIVDELPGRFTLSGYLAERIENEGPVPTDLFQEVIEQERVNRELIRRPPFYYLIAGHEWQRPAVRIERDAAAQEEIPAEADRLIRQIRAIEARIARLERQLEREAEDQRERREDEDDSPRGSIDPLPRAPQELEWPSIPRTWRAQFGGGAGPDDDNQGEGTAGLLEEQRRLLEEAIQRLADEFGLNPDGSLIDETIEDEFEAEFLPLLHTDSDIIKVWSHDITAVRGETYRYAIQLEVTNPLYPFADRLLDDAQREAAADPLITGLRGAWTDPVALPQEVRYFVTDAEPAGAGVGGFGPSDASVDVEAFVFFYGSWRMADARLRLGDAVQASAEIDPELPIFTIEERTAGQFVAPESVAIGRSTHEVRIDELLLDVISGFASEPIEVVLFRGSSGRIIERIAERASEAAAQLERLSMLPTVVREPIGDDLATQGGSAPGPGGSGGGGSSGGTGGGFGGSGFGGAGGSGEGGGSERRRRR